MAWKYNGLCSGSVEDARRGELANHLNASAKFWRLWFKDLFIVLLLLFDFLCVYVFMWFAFFFFPHFLMSRRFYFWWSPIFFIVFPLWLVLSVSSLKIFVDPKIVKIFYIFFLAAVLFNFYVLHYDPFQIKFCV